ncbi:MAG: sugar transferase, partial [Sneathiella sp.]|nr:sugar transferase [Sneathiella sp.]
MNKIDKLPDSRNHSWQSKSYPISSRVMSGLFSFLDTSLLLAAGFIAFSAVIGNPFYMREIYLFAIFFIFTSYFFVGRFARIYGFTAIMSPLKTISKIGVTCLITFMLLLALAFSLKISDQFSRIWMYSFFTLSFLFLVVFRLIGYGVITLMARHGIISRNIIILGAGEQAAHLVKRLTHGFISPINKIVGIFDDRKTRTHNHLRNFPILGNIHELKHFCRTNHVDDIIVALPWNADQRQVDIVHQLRELPAHIHLVSDLVAFRFPNKPSPNHFGNIPMIEVLDSALSGWDCLVKWLEDKILSAILLVLFIPVFLSIALAIRLESKGPVFFKQKRYGFNNQEFEIYKFRSMYHQDFPEKT